MEPDTTSTTGLHRALTVTIVVTLVGIVAVGYFFIKPHSPSSLNPQTSGLDESADTSIDTLRADLPQVIEITSLNVTETEPTLPLETVTVTPLSHSDQSETQLVTNTTSPSQGENDTVVNSNSVQFSSESSVDLTPPPSDSETNLTGTIIDVDTTSGILLLRTESNLVKIQIASNTEVSIMGQLAPVTALHGGDIVNITGSVLGNASSMLANQIDVTGTVQKVR